MGQATSKGNEAKSKMKQPPDIAELGFIPENYRFVTNHTTS